ncbi:MAG: Nif11 family protein [Bacilli bacterium]|nr:Nif11 family protein [Bacilli bacterium]
MKEELLKGLSEEQIAKIKACKSQEEILKLAKEEGFELTDEQLEAVNGGFCTDDTPKCPNCGSKHVSRLHVYDGIDYNCRECYYTWRVYSNKK